LDTHAPLLLGLEIIDKRNLEGEFINDSLKNLRGDIQTILSERNSEAIYYAPAIDPTCIKNYCPTLNECFSGSGNRDNMELSDMMNWVIKQYADFNAPFMNDCIISVFCVFNITPGVNEPPLIPYVDINEFENTWKKLESYAVSTLPEKISVQIEQVMPTKSTILSRSIEYIQKNRTDDYKAHYKSVVRNLENLDAIIDGSQFAESFKGIITNEAEYTNGNNKEIKVTAINELQNQIDTAINEYQIKKRNTEEKVKTNITDYTGEIEYLKELYKIIKEFVETRSKNIALNTIVGSNEWKNFYTTMEALDKSLWVNVTESDKTEYIGNVIEPFIALVKRYNASSDIGTISYLDNFAKSNTVDTICLSNGKSDIYTRNYSDEMARL
jgi:hypothetical protein